MDREPDNKIEETLPENAVPPRRGGKRVAPKKDQKGEGSEMYQNIRTLVSVLVVLILLFTFVVRLIVVSGPSMEDTLHNGDTMLVWSLGYQPRQGDIIVLTKKSYQEDSIVKRVIAVEGQTVDIDYYSNTVCVDGVPLEEDYIKDWMYVPSYGDVINHITVPEGCIFVMGDNRNESADSRYPGIGIVDSRCVIGRAILVLYPFSRFGGL